MSFWARVEIGVVSPCQAAICFANFYVRRPLRDTESFVMGWQGQMNYEGMSPAQTFQMGKGDYVLCKGLFLKAQ